MLAPGPQMGTIRLTPLRSETTLLDIYGQKNARF
jgi:hypothetical protein